MQLQSDQAKRLRCLNGSALLRQRDPAALEVEGVQIVVVEEADDAHPRAGDAVGVEGVEGGVEGRRDFAAEGLGVVGVRREALEGLVPEVVGRRDA